MLNKDEEVLTEDVINEGLKFKIPGRLQKMADNIYFDGAHNPAGIEKSINTLFAIHPFDDNK